MNRRKFLQVLAAIGVAPIAAAVVPEAEPESRAEELTELSLIRLDAVRDGVFDSKGRWKGGKASEELRLAVINIREQCGIWGDRSAWPYIEG